MPDLLKKELKDNELVSIGEAADYLDVSIDTLRRWHKSGKIKCTRPNGKNRYFSPKELERVKFSKPLSITKAAEQLGLSPSTLRRLEEKGIIKPERGSNGTRLYSKKCIEGFLKSDYYLKKHKLEEAVEKVLESSDLIPDIAVPAVPRESSEALKLEYIVREQQKEIAKLSAMRRFFVSFGIFLTTSFALIISVLTLFFLAFPEQSADFLGYDYTSERIASSSSDLSGGPTVTGRVLGESVEDPSTVAKVLRPFSEVSLKLVKRIDRETYDQIIPREKNIKDVSDIFVLNDEGNIISLYDIEFSGDSEIRLPDDLDAFSLQGKSPGSGIGDLAYFSSINTIEGLIIKNTSLLDGVISGGLGGAILDGSITNEDLSEDSILSTNILDGEIDEVDIKDDAITSEKIKDGEIDTDDLNDDAVTAGKIADGTITASDISSTLTFSSFDFIDLSNIDHSSTALQGLLLPNVSSASPSSPSSGEGYLSYDTSGDQVIVYTGSSWVQVGSGDITNVAVGDGLSGGGVTGDVTVSLDVVTSGTTSTTSANSGLELAADGMSLIRGCADNQILKWDAGSNVWQCEADSGGGGGVVDIEENDALVVSGATNVDFLGADFIVTAVSTEANVAIDYVNSGITRVGQAETITGGWIFNTADTTFTTAIDVNGDLTIADTTIVLDGASTDFTATGNLSFNTDDLFVEKATGMVGVGTTDPSYTLDILGSLNSTTFYIGGTLVSSTPTELNLLDGRTGILLDTNNAAAQLSSWDQDSSNDLLTSTSFGGDVSGIYSAVVISDDSHSHTSTTLPATTSFLGSDIALGSEVSGTLPVGSGGTGVATFTSNGILYGNGTSAIQVSAAGTNNYILYSNSGTPAWMQQSSINAGQVDGIEGASFLRGDASDEFETGNTLTFTGTLDSNGDVSFADTDIALDGSSTNFSVTGNLSFNTNDLLIEKATSMVGIGTTNPGYTLDVMGDINIATGSNFKINGTNLAASDIGAEPTLSKGNLTETTSNVLTITGGTNAVIGSGTTIQVDTDLANYNNSSSAFIDLTDLSSTATGLTYTSGTGVFSTTSGYVIPTTTQETNWESAYTNRITSATSPLDITANVISISQANGSTNGYLSSTDWTTFNNKQSALTFSTGLTNNSGTITVNNSEVVHDSLSGFVADEHIDWTDTSSNFGTTGTLGIGTTAPTDNLHVVGNIYTTAGLHIGADSTDNLIDDATNGTGSTTLYIGDEYILVSGDVGVLVQGYDAGTTVLGSDIALGSEVSGTLPVGSGGTGTTSFITNGLVFGNSTNALLQDPSNLFWDDSSNYLGIGTSNPSTPLDVVGNINIASGSTFKIDGTDLAASDVGAEPTLSKGNLTETTSNVLTITGGTNAIIGGGTTIEVDTDLSNYSNATSAFLTSATETKTFLALTDTFSTYTAGSLLFTNGSAVTQDSSSLFWNDGSNYLGIGKSNPSSALDVSGNIAGSGTLDVASTIQAGSSDVTLTDSSGYVLHDALVDCADTQILKWSTGGSRWECSSDATGGGGSPWTSDIDADGYDLTDISNVLFRETTGAPTSTDVGLFRDNSGDLNANVLMGKAFNIQVNGSDEYIFSSTGINLGSNNLTSVGTVSGGTFDSTNTIQSGAYGAASIDGDDINSNIAGNGITLTVGTPDTLDIDLLDSQDGTGVTSTNSGLEFQGSGSNELALLQGCADNQILKWTDASGVWACSDDSAGGGSGTLDDAYNLGQSITVDAADLLFNLANSTNDYSLTVDNSSSGEIAKAIDVVTTTGTFITGLDVSDGGITNAISIGTNNILTGGATIASTELDILDSGITLSELTDSGTLTAGTVDINGGNVDGTAIGLSSASTGAFTTVTTSSTLGVGTTAPTDTLHVVGNILATAGLHIGVDGDSTLIDDAINGASSTTLYIGSESILVSGDIGVLVQGHDADTTVLGSDIALGSEVSGTLPVASGGTGVGTFTSNGILYGNGTSAVQVTAAGDNGYILYSNSGTPAWMLQSSINAGQVDGIEGASFLRGDASDEFETGNTLTLTGTLDSNGDVSFADTSIVLDGVSTNFAVTGDLSFNTNDLVVEKSTGMIGIGTTNPGYTLDVVGDVNIATGSNFKINGTNLAASDIGAEPTLSKGNLTETTSNVLTITGGTSAVIGSGTTIQVDTDLSNYNNSSSAFLTSATETKTFLTLTDTQAAFTSGALLFTSGSAVTDDPSSLFWNDGSNYLGIGKSNPSTALDVAGTGTFSAVTVSTGALAVNGDSITADGATLTINAAGTVDIQDAVIVDSLTLDTGNLDVTGTIEAGSGNVTLTDATGYVLHDALVDCADTEILKWSTGGGRWGCAADATGGGSGTLDDAYNLGQSITVDAADLLLILSNDTNDYGFVVDNNTTGLIDIAVEVTTTGVGGTFTTAFDASDGGLTNAISIGTNNILTAGATIASTELDLLDSGIILSELTDSGTLTAGTVDINGGAIDGVTIGGTVAGAGTFTSAIITTGALAVNGDSITSDGATLTINAAGTVDIQDAVVVDSLTLDTGNLDVTGTIEAGSGNITLTDATGYVLHDALVDCTDTQILKWSTGGSRWECAADATGGGSGTLDDAYNLGQSIAVDAADLLFNLANSTNDYSLTVDNSSSGEIDKAIDVVTTTGTFITGLDVSDGGITNAISIGTNNILTGGATIASTELDLLDSGIALSELTDSGTLTAGTVDINGGLIDNVAIGGTTPAAGTFTAVTVTTSALAVNSDSITADGATLTINAAGAVDIQDALNADSITSDAGVSIAAASAYTGAGAVTLSSGASAGLTLDSASGTISIAAGDALGNGTWSINSSGVGSSLTATDLSCTDCIDGTEISALTLGTDTTGNYVASVTDGTGITGGDGGGSASALTLAVDQATSFAWTADHTYTLAETEDLALNIAISGSNSGQGEIITLTNSSASGNQYGLVIDNASSSGTTESLLRIDNSDIDTAVTNAIEFVDAGGTFTNLFNVDGTLITSAEFTILDSGLALSELTDSGTLTAGTVDINGGAIDGVTIGGAVAGVGTFTSATITTGALAVNSDSITADGATLTINAAGTVDIQDAVIVDSLTLDTGNLDVTGTIEAGSSNVVLTDASGYVLHDALVDCADTEILKWSTGGGRWGCAADATGGGSGTLDDAYNLGQSITVDAADLLFNLANSTNDYSLTVDNSSSGEIAKAIGVATTTGTFITGLDVSDGGITNAISIGTNNILTGGATIASTELDLLDSGIILSELTDSGTLTAGTVDINGGAVDGVTIGGVVAGAGTFTGVTVTTGALAVNGDSITSDGATLTINAAGTVDIQDAVIVDSLTLDTGNLDVTGTIEAGSGNITLTDATGYVLHDALVDCADTEILKWSTGGARWGCAADATGGGSGTLDDAYNLGQSIAVDVADLLFNLADATNDYSLTVDNSSSGEIAKAIDVVTTTGTFITGLDVSDGGITNAISIGTNNILTAGATIASTELDLLDSGIALSELTDSGTLTAGTVDINGGNIDGTAIGVSVAGAGTFTGVTVTTGALAVNGDSITSDGATLTIDAAGAVDIQDALNADSITSDAGVSIAAANAYTGAGAVTLSSGASAGLTLDSASGTVSIAAGDALGNGTWSINSSGVGTSLTATDLSCTDCIGGTEISVLTLGTDTTGNYVASVTNGTGITGGDGGSGGAALTLAIDQDTAFAWSNAHTYTLAETEDLALDIAISGSNSGQGEIITLTNSSASGNQYGIVLDNAPSSGVTESLLRIDNSDTDTAVTNAIEFVDAGGTFTNLFNVDGTLITSAEFTILDSGLALSELTDSGTLTAGTVDINGGAIDGVTIGGAVAGAGTFTQATITTSALAVNSDSITADGATLTINAGGTVDIQDAVIVDSLTLDTGNLDVAGTIEAGSSNVVLTDATGYVLHDALVDCADTQILKWSTGGARWGCAADESGGGGTWDTIGDAAAAGTVVMTEYAQVLDWNTAASSAAFNGLTLTMTNDATTDGGDQKLLVLDNLDDALGTGTTESLLTLDNSDTNEAVINGIEFLDAGGGFTNFLNTPSIDISGVGAITGATGVSTTTVTASSAIAANGGITFDASTDTLGAFTAAGNIDLNTSYVLTNVGAAGTDFSGTGGLTLADNLTVTTGGATITAGALAVNSDSITSDGTLIINAAGAIDMQDDVTVDGLTVDTNGITVSTGAVAINSDSITSDGVLVVNATSSVQLGDGATNYFDFSETGGPTYYGTARPTKKVTLIPEFPGAVLTGDGGSNIGTMTSDFCSNGNTNPPDINTGVCSTSGDVHNYYTWTAQATNDYDIWVNWQVPSDFDEFASTTAISFYGWRDSVSDTVTLTFYDDANNTCGSATSTGATYDAWATTNYADPTGCDDTNIVAGDIVTFRYQLSVGVNSEFARAGEITIEYKAKF